MQTNETGRASDKYLLDIDENICAVQRDATDVGRTRRVADSLRFTTWVAYRRSRCQRNQQVYHLLSHNPGIQSHRLLPRIDHTSAFCNSRDDSRQGVRAINILSVFAHFAKHGKGLNTRAASLSCLLGMAQALSRPCIYLRTPRLLEFLVDLTENRMCSIVASLS